MNTHRIAISMEDTDIERETTTLIITTKDSLATVSEKLNTAFEKFDRAEGVAADYREDGWGIDSFVAYLEHRYRKGWTIEEDIPDETLEFIGM